MKYILIFLSFVISHQGQAQLPDYYVYFVTGDVILKKKGGKSAPIKQKDLVFKTDTIILKKGARVTLVDKDASYLDLNTAKTYVAWDLPNQVIKKGNDGVAGKYLKLLFHELIDPSQDFDKFKKNNVAGIAGGVSRGDDCNNRIFPINGLKTSASSIVFKWHKTSPSSNYSFEIYDGNSNEQFKINVKDTTRELNINEAIKNKTGVYAWRVMSKDGTCEDEMPAYFEVMTQEKEKEQVKALLKATGNESMEMQLQQIDKLEKNGYIYSAFSQYSLSVKANPDNKALMKSYVAFLLKYGFDEEARTAWKP